MVPDEWKFQWLYFVGCILAIILKEIIQFLEFFQDDLATETPVFKDSYPIL